MHTFRFTYHTERYNLLKGATVSCNKKMNRRILPLSCLCTILWPQYRYHICCFQLPPRSIRFALPKYCNHASTIHIRSQRSLKLQWRNVTEFQYFNFPIQSDNLPLIQTSCPRRQYWPPVLLGFLAQLLLEPPWQSKHLSASVMARKPTTSKRKVTTFGYTILEMLKI